MEHTVMTTTEPLTRGQKYYQKHKEQVKAYFKQDYHCDVCDMTIQRGSLVGHRKAPIHKLKEELFNLRNSKIEN